MIYSSKSEHHFIPKVFILPEKPYSSRVGKLFNYFEAKRLGLKSASAWKKEGRIVIPDVTPAGFVVIQVERSIGLSNLEYAVLESLGNNHYTVVRNGWYVYSYDQTIPKTNKSSIKSISDLNSISKQEIQQKEQPTPVPVGHSPYVIHINNREKDISQTTEKQHKAVGGSAPGGLPPYVIHINNRQYPKRDNRQWEGTGVWLSIPQNLKIPDSHKDVAEEIYYYLHTILMGKFNNKHDLDGTTRINRRLIQQILGNPKKETKARKFLLENGILYTDHTYSEGEFSKSYGLNPLYAQQITRYEVTKPKLANKIKLARLKRLDLKTEREVKRSYIVDYLDVWAKRIEIDLDICQREVENLPNPTFHLIPAVSIANRDYRLQRDDYGRVHSPFTQLWTPLRTALRFQKQPLYNIDIRNSQIVFLSKMLREDYLVNNRPEASDVRKFIGLVEKGEIYDYLLKNSQEAILAYLTRRKMREQRKIIWHEQFLIYICSIVRPKKALEWKFAKRAFQRQHPIKSIEMSITEVVRSDFKQMLFADVFYGKREINTPITQLFQREFPSVHQFILDQKVENYKNLARDMQRAESELMIDTVCLRLMSYHPEIPVVTIHDSIMTTGQYVPTVARIIREEFERIGFRPSLKVS